MTRIDMTTREWHGLIKPVLPHCLKDGDYPELDRVRIEVTGSSVVAVATDRHTIGAERHPLGMHTHGTRPVALSAPELAATLKLFPYSKDDDPPLRITIDTATVPITLAGTPASAGCMALTVEDEGGCRVVLRDGRDPNRDPLANWRRNLRAVLRRSLTTAPPALSLHATHLARWAAAVRKGERLAFYTGDKDSDLILVLVEDHFAGLWVPTTYLDGPDRMLAESPWNHELRGAGLDEDHMPAPTRRTEPRHTTTGRRGHVSEQPAEETVVDAEAEDTEATGEEASADGDGE